MDTQKSNERALKNETFFDSISEQMHNFAMNDRDNVGDGVAAIFIATSNSDEREKEVGARCNLTVFGEKDGIVNAIYKSMKHNSQFADCVAGAATKFALDGMPGELADLLRKLERATSKRKERSSELEENN